MCREKEKNSHLSVYVKHHNQIALDHKLANTINMIAYVLMDVADKATHKLLGERVAVDPHLAAQSPTCALGQDVQERRLACTRLAHDRDLSSLRWELGVNKWQR